MLADQDRIARDERAEALSLLRQGQRVRVWRDGRILVLSDRSDVDLVWPLSKGRRGAGSGGFDA